MSHTPGEWVAKWSKYQEGKFIVQTTDPSKRVIASFDDDGDGAGEQSIADARLISAAPDLLEALKLFVEEYVELVNSGDAGFWDPEKEEKVKKARAAISKATQE